jgi:hypothetical protein
VAGGFAGHLSGCVGAPTMIANIKRVLVPAYNKVLDCKCLISQKKKIEVRNTMKKHFGRNAVFWYHASGAAGLTRKFYDRLLRFY